MGQILLFIGNIMIITILLIVRLTEYIFIIFLKMKYIGILKLMENIEVDMYLMIFFYSQPMLIKLLEFGI